MQIVQLKKHPSLCYTNETMRCYLNTVTFTAGLKLRYTANEIEMVYHTPGPR